MLNASPSAEALLRAGDSDTLEAAILLHQMGSLHYQLALYSQAGRECVHSKGRFLIHLNKCSRQGHACCVETSWCQPLKVNTTQLWQQYKPWACNVCVVSLRSGKWRLSSPKEKPSKKVPWENFLAELRLKSQAVMHFDLARERYQGNALFGEMLQMWYMSALDS